jgi:putative intracellular protease/amidase
MRKATFIPILLAVFALAASQLIGSHARGDTSKKDGVNPAPSDNIRPTGSKPAVSTDKKESSPQKTPEKAWDNRGKTKVYCCPPCGNDCDKLTFDKPGVCPHCGMTLIAQTDRRRTTVAILLFDGVEIIDYSGPWEVFGQAGFEVFSVAEKLDPIETTFGQRVVPKYTIDNCPKCDILLIPGGRVLAQMLENSKLLDWIKSNAKDAQYVMSVCTGAFLLAKAGLLDGQSATTFYRSIDGLAKYAPKTKLVYDQRFVDNGKVITTAGLSSGIDGAFHLVEKILGKGTAQATALGLEYQWQPDSNYARAAFADRYLPRIVGLDSKLISVEGDRDHWELRRLVSEPGSAPEIAALISKQIKEGTPHASGAVAMQAAPTDTRKDRREFQWTFTDEKGRGWRGACTIEPTADDKGKFSVSLKLSRK